METLTGTGITLKVEVSDSIDAVKSDLQIDLRVHPDTYRLVFAEKQLEEGHTLSFYNIESGDALVMVPYDMQIIVKILTGESITLHEDPFDDISIVKVMINDKRGMTPDQQCLLFNMTDLYEGAKLWDYDIRHRSELQLRGRS